MEKEERPPEEDGIAEAMETDTKMWLLKYCFARPALLLTEAQVKVYLQMMAAVNRSPYDIRPF